MREENAILCTVLKIFLCQITFKISYYYFFFKKTTRPRMVCVLVGYTQTLF